MRRTVSLFHSPASRFRCGAQSPRARTCRAVPETRSASRNPHLPDTTRRFIQQPDLFEETAPEQRRGHGSHMDRPRLIPDRRVRPSGAAAPGARGPRNFIESCIDDGRDRPRAELAAGEPNVLMTAGGQHASQSQSGSSVTSLLRIAIQSASHDLRSPRFTAAAKPRLLPKRSTLAPARSAISAEPSVEPLSTTMISSNGRVCRSQILQQFGKEIPPVPMRDHRRHRHALKGPLCCRASPLPLRTPHSEP